MVDLGCSEVRIEKAKWKGFNMKKEKLLSSSKWRHFTATFYPPREAFPGDDEDEDDGGDDDDDDG